MRKKRKGRDSVRERERKMLQRPRERESGCVRISLSESKRIMGSRGGTTRVKEEKKESFYFLFLV